MSQPNQILKCLHSCWIDELNLKFPDDKLELGLPKRLTGWGILESTNQTRSCEVQTSEVRGLTSWGWAKGQNPQEIEKLAQLAIQRSTSYAKLHHGLALTFGKVQESRPFEPGCSIWFPISVSIKGQRMVFDLGVSF